MSSALSDDRRQEGPAGEPTSLGRRRLLDLALTGGIAGWLATILYPVLSFLSPLQESTSAGEAVLGDKAKKDLADEGFAIVALGTERVLVFADPQGRLRATSAKCTHEGCTVRYKRDEGLIWCACHNGRFDLDGRVISGPPPRALVPYRTSGTLETKVVVSRSEEA